jgi:hypothetical protein
VQYKINKKSGQTDCPDILPSLAKEGLGEVILNLRITPPRPPLYQGEEKNIV